MSTTLIETKDKHGVSLELYDSSAGCTLFLRLPGEERGIKFDVTGESAAEIVLGLQLSRNIFVS